MTRSTSAREIRQAVKIRNGGVRKPTRYASPSARVRVTQRSQNSSTASRNASSGGSVRYGDLAVRNPSSKNSASTASSRQKKRIKMAPIASSTAPQPSSAARDLGLGNGSPSSEFLSAATRLLGIKDGFLHKSFLRHLLSVSAIDPKIKAPHNVYAGLVFERFRDGGREVKSPKPGDLVFFSTPVKDGRAVEDRFTAAAVLEAIEPGGVYRCIGWVLGKVQRFKMDPRRPRLRRDERTGDRINDVIRERSMGEGAGQPALAGQLLVGFLRL